MLISKGANIEEDEFGNTPLDDAAKSDSLEIAQILMNKEENQVDKENRKYVKHIAHAVQFNSEKVCQFLLDYDMDFQVDDNDKDWSLLNIAAIHNSNKAAKILIKDNINSRNYYSPDFDGNETHYYLTPLHNVALYNAKETIVSEFWQ